MSFYDQLDPVISLDDALDPSRYRPAPGDWQLAITDIEGSTRAVERGQQKSVNMIAASCIAAVRNICVGMELPYLFGGDGATILIPPEHADAAFAALSGVRAFADANAGLKLRAGAMRVGDLRGYGHDIMVARYEVSPGNCFAMFRGGGVGFLDLVLKGRKAGVSADIVTLPEQAAEPDLSGLSCRWQPIASRSGCMVSLVVAMADHDGDYRQVLHRLLEIAGDGADPTTPEMLETALRRRWLPSSEAIAIEIAAAGQKSRFGRLQRRLAILTGAVVLQLALRFGRRPSVLDRFLAETARNSDFCKIDDALQMVIDCTPDALVRIEAYLMQLEATGTIGFGLYVSDAAVMTCLVKSMAENRHVHFIDGAGGGYTRASKALRDKIEAREAAA
ncbi:MAG TPA: DUF3095 family protein [Aliidongia sp.]|uniref:DUF3095 family protein n=1 Tax=Aliidongia sp. TaxID=1914230 RepID=UPI002DDD1FEE|nr:DUF3095 family protein [Aliidongia sp.]HEV2676482.1 DUF3095 family protein [Aliidongia sp.]